MTLQTCLYAWITVGVLSVLATAQTAESQTVAAQTPEMTPLSAEAALRVAKLLEEFDPNSYSLDIKFIGSSGEVSTITFGRAVGLADVQQSSVEREFTAAAAAGTNTNNNIFKVAGTNTNNNIFRIASTNTNNNIFKVAGTNTNNNIFRTSPGTNTNNNIFRVEGTNTNNNIFSNQRQASAILELKSILEGTFDIGMEAVTTEELVEMVKLLEEFDPNSYSLTIPVASATEGLKTVRLGKAVGLADLRQTSLEREFAGAVVAGTNTNNNIFRVAGTNTNNNIFRVASTNTNNNIFKVAGTNTNNNIFKVAGTNTNNNIFVNGQQAAAAQKLNAILKSKHPGQ